MNIVLIGYRGCGKTTIGKLLASELWKTYADVDVVTCERFNNHSIADIWEKFGEPAWRKMEVQVTQELVVKPKMVIGLGGGTLMQPDARTAVEQAPETIRIYLKCDAEELFRRIQNDAKSTATRPALTSKGGGLDEIQEVLSKREPTYLAVSNKVLDVTHLNPADAVRYLIEKCL